jgi:hypothetical protein
MTHDNLICDMCDIYDMCHAQKAIKCPEKQKNGHSEIEQMWHIVTVCDNVSLRHLCDTKDYFFDKKKVQLFFTLKFHAAVRGEW